MMDEAEESCLCAPGGAIKLMEALSDTRLFCLSCNLALPLVQASLSDDCQAAIGRWGDRYRGIYLRWLEDDAVCGELANVHSAVNQMGRALQPELNFAARCYYWLHQDRSGAKPRVWSRCPSCGGPVRSEAMQQLICEACSLVFAG